MSVMTQMNQNVRMLIGNELTEVFKLEVDCILYARVASLKLIR